MHAHPHPDDLDGNLPIRASDEPGQLAADASLTLRVRLGGGGRPAFGGERGNLGAGSPGNASQEIAWSQRPRTRGGGKPRQASRETRNNFEGLRPWVNRGCPMLLRSKARTLTGPCRPLSGPSVTSGLYYREAQASTRTYSKQAGGNTQWREDGGHYVNSTPPSLLRSRTRCPATRLPIVTFQPFSAEVFLECASSAAVCSKPKFFRTLFVRFLPAYFLASPEHVLSEDSIIADGTTVRYWASSFPDADYEFAFQDGRYRNTYLLNCSGRRFKWIDNYDLKFRRSTDNAAGADWRRLNTTSNKANGVYERACVNRGQIFRQNFPSDRRPV